jgi:hypothetical protein
MTFTLEQLRDAGLPEVFIMKRPIIELVERRKPVEEINIHGEVIQGEAVTFDEVVIGEEEYPDTDFENNVHFVETPTDEQWQIFCDIRDGVGYAEKRAREYPPLDMLADAIYHQAKGDDSKMQEYLAAVQAVKDKYPKDADAGMLTWE